MKRIIYLFLLIIPSSIFGQKSFSTGTFERKSDFKLMNTAKIIGGNVQLTDAAEWVTGGFWYKDKVPVEHGFECSFQIYIDKIGGWQNTGADGLAFVINNDPKGLSVGDPGEGIGYEGMSNALAVEFDTFDNNEGGNNHVSIQTNGKGRLTRFNNHSLAINHKIPQLRGKTLSIKITYDFRYMKVFIDNKLYIKKTVALEQLLKLDKGKAWIGFTSSTAGAYSRHRILNWKWLAKRKILAFKPKYNETEMANVAMSYQAILRKRKHFQVG